MKNDNKNNQGADFSQEKGNIELVKGEDLNKIQQEKIDSESVHIGRDSIDVKKSGNLVIGSLNIVADPIKGVLKDRHKKHYKESKFHLVADIILAGIIIALVATFFIIRGLDTGVDLGIETKLIGDYATSGEIETFEITYHNPSDEMITDTNITVRFPENFFLEGVVPSNVFNRNTNTFEIGNLAGGANGKIRVDGRVLGEINSRQVMTFSFNYQTGKKTKNVLNSLVYSIEDSGILVDIETPKEIYKDVPFKAKLIVQNNTGVNHDNDLEFIIKSTDIDIENISHKRAVLNNNAIILSGLENKEKVEIEIDAMVSRDIEKTSFALESYINVDSGKIKQGQAHRAIKVSVPKFSAQISADKEIISEGETVNFDLKYENKEAEDISDLKIIFYTTDSAFRIDKLTLEESPKYTISETNLDFVESVKTDDSGVLNIEVLITRKNIGVNQEVGLGATISYNLSGRNIEYKVYSPNIKFLSDLQVSSRGVYYSTQGDQLGIGPMPPIVGVPTRYWIFWEVDNLGSRLENLSVSAILPSNVFWTEQKSLIAGKIRYGSIGKKIAWNIDEIDSSDGKYRAGFEIEFVPNESNFGKVVDILENIEYSAFDTFAQKEISGKLSNINTNLKDDSVASGQGTVVRMDVVY